MIALLEHVIPVEDRDPARRYGLRSVHSDLTSRNGFQYPTSGEIRSDHAINKVNKTGCPVHPGDGLCVGLTWYGVAQGCMPATTLLAVSWHPDDRLGGDHDKVRVRALRVERVVDGAKLVREHGAGANLFGADLRYADLGDADLRSADLRCTHLHWADLRGADLRDAVLGGAILLGAVLRGANLGGANLGGAVLGGAVLGGAVLGGADLRDADLNDADLRDADLRCADLSFADLRGADLRWADLGGAVLRGAVWPDGTIK